MRIPGQTLILTALVLMSGDSWGAPQNNWYAESDRDLGFLDGLSDPVDVAHGPGGRAFVVEIMDTGFCIWTVIKMLSHWKGHGTIPSGQRLPTGNYLWWRLQHTVYTPSMRMAPNCSDLVPKEPMMGNFIIPWVSLRRIWTGNGRCTFRIPIKAKYRCSMSMVISGESLAQ